MDEYTLHHHDLAELKYLCSLLFNQGMAALDDSNHGWVNDPTSAISLQLNDLLEHISTFGLTFRLKYPQDSELTELLDTYLDETYDLFSNYSINDQALKKWFRAKGRILRYLAGEQQSASELS